MDDCDEEYEGCEFAESLITTELLYFVNQHGYSNFKKFSEFFESNKFNVAIIYIVFSKSYNEYARYILDNFNIITKDVCYNIIYHSATTNTGMCMYIIERYKLDKLYCLEKSLEFAYYDLARILLYQCDIRYDVWIKLFYHAFNTKNIESVKILFTLEPTYYYYNTKKYIPDFLYKCSHPKLMLDNLSQMIFDYCFEINQDEQAAEFLCFGRYKPCTSYELAKIIAKNCNVKNISVYQQKILDELD
jgi:hypothetical protein